MLVGARAEVYSWVGLRKGYSTKLPLIRRWRCGARVVEEPGLKRPNSQTTLIVDRVARSTGTASLEGQCTLQP